MNTVVLCGVCHGTFTSDDDDVIGGRLALPPILRQRQVIRHAHLGCYRLFREYGLRVPRAAWGDR